MADIFISYSHADREAATPIAAALGKAGLAVWWDRHLVGGVRYSAETERALNEARVIIVIWSAAAARSMWVADEAAVGRDKGNLVPISIDGAQAPIGFRQIQIIDFSNSESAAAEEKLAALMTAVNRKLERDPAAEPEESMPPQQDGAIAGSQIGAVNVDQWRLANRNEPRF